jgi:hypothetical protein
LIHPEASLSDEFTVDQQRELIPAGHRKPNRPEPHVGVRDRTPSRQDEGRTLVIDSLARIKSGDDQLQSLPALPVSE